MTERDPVNAPPAETLPVEIIVNWHGGGTTCG
jgi:hypothetical protein